MGKQSQRDYASRTKPLPKLMLTVHMRFKTSSLVLPLAVWLASGCLVHPACALKTIYVKILVDEEEPARDDVWQKRLRDRLADATRIIQPYCGVRFEIIAFDRWHTDNRLHDFTQSLKEFETEVDASPARVAIGFTSQYRIKKGRDQLGGTRGPLNSHILIREGTPTVFEPDHLEVLVHELGHHLGAAHSNRPDSVMRNVVADGRARAKGYRIRFDPLNGSAIRIVGGEITRRGIKGFPELSIDAKMKLRKIYQQIAFEFPDDTAAPRFQRFIDRSMQPALRSARP